MVSRPCPSPNAKNYPLSSASGFSCIGWRTISPKSPHTTSSPGLAGDLSDRRSAAEPRIPTNRESLTLEYYPRHCLKTGRLLAVEAMPRWPHRISGNFSSTLNPTTLAERHAVRMSGITLLQMACTEAAQWPLPEVRLSIKLLTPLPNSEELCLQISSVLTESGLAAECLELALPETFPYNLDEDSGIAFASLRDIGVNLLLDEFGHAVASLIALRDMPLTAMKVDRLMLRSLPADAANLAILQAAVQTAHAMGLRVCADSVDLETLKKALAAIGVDEGQGLAFTPPLSAEELRGYLRATARR